MKKIAHSIILCFVFLSIKAQVFVQRATDESITINPRGIQSKFANTIHTSNTAVGINALLSLNTGVTDNSAFGEGALRNTTTGTNNSAFGAGALLLNTIGLQNCAFGEDALYNNTEGSYNVAIGEDALRSNTVGGLNTAVGDDALFGNASGNRNVALGFHAADANIGASENMGIGFETLKNHSASLYLVLAGQEKLTQNMAIGYQSLYYTNPSNAVIGGVSGNGIRNMGIGYQTLYNNARGEENTAIGYQAGFSVTNGNRNVFVGYKAGYNTDADDVLVIENSDANRALIRGDFANDKVGINRLKTDLDATSFTFQVNGDASKNTAGNWSSHSDRRLKKNISYLNSHEMLQKVLNLKGVTYEWNDTKTGTKRPDGLQYGFIAQEIKEVFPNKIQEDKNGYLMTAYGDYDPMFVESIKALKSLIDEQRKMIESQQNEIIALKNKVDLYAENKNSENSKK